MRIDLGSGAARIRRKGEPRIARWLHPILEVPLELKLFGANLIIVGVALLLLFGPVKLQPSRLTDAYIVVAVLMLGAAVNVGLVRLATDRRRQQRQRFLILLRQHVSLSERALCVRIVLLRFTLKVDCFFQIVYRFRVLLQIQLRKSRDFPCFRIVGM